LYWRLLLSELEWGTFLLSALHNTLFTFLFINDIISVFKVRFSIKMLLLFLQAHQDHRLLVKFEQLVF
jgi:hypothetical protein